MVGVAVLVGNLVARRFGVAVPVVLGAVGLSLDTTSGGPTPGSLTCSTNGFDDSHGLCDAIFLAECVSYRPGPLLHGLIACRKANGCC